MDSHTTGGTANFARPNTLQTPNTHKSKGEMASWLD